MPMAIIFAEIAAAELAAAAAAEAAAVTAAEVAAAEAASVAAAEAASTAAAQAATQAATQQATTAGIMEVGGATANAPLTAEAVQSAAMNSGMPPPAPPAPQFVNNPQGIPANVTTSPVIDGGITSVPQAAPLVAPPAASPVNPMGLEMPGAYSPGNIQGADPNFFNQSATVAPGPGPLPNPQYQLNAPTGGQGMRLGSSLESVAAPTTPMTSVLPPPSGLEAGFDKALKFAKENPFPAMTGAYMGASALGLLNPSGNTFNDKPYDGPLSRYKLSPNFQGSTANPANFQYDPATNRRYADGGGIMGAESYDIPVGYAEGEMVDEYVPEYAKGGSLSDSIESYQKMLSGQPQAAPTKSPDVGIYYDQDPDTRYQDALTAAQIRQAKVNKRANMQLPGPKRPTPMGQLNLKPVGSAATASESSLDPETAKHGGIMHSSLGGYAAGGNPRLLKGPGDGMSDNIPATINGRQPARLADGEFVIPADVVSHLGNGSTEAGAKQLHAMMNKVRSARTGNSKQGKQIKPQKYMPK